MKFKKNVETKDTEEVLSTFGKQFEEITSWKFKEIYIRSEILRKGEGNFKTADLRKFFLYFGNNSRKQ